MSTAATGQNGRREYCRSDHYKRVRAFKRRGFEAINGQTYAGREAKKWRAEMIANKGGDTCPRYLCREIDLAMFDLWLLLELGEVIAQDAKRRGTVINQRRKQLPKVHEQYQSVSARFEKRCEAINAAKPLDLARRLMMQNGGQRT